VAVVNEAPRRDEVWLVSLDPKFGSELRKMRPCLAVSPDESNRHLPTVIIAPLTTAERPYPTRLALTFQGKRGQVALDQLRAVDRQRLVRKLGRVSGKFGEAVSNLLVEMFARQIPPASQG
jgi:mRNA interferase MazF